MGEIGTSSLVGEFWHLSKESVGQLLSGFRGTMHLASAPHPAAATLSPLKRGEGDGALPVPQAPSPRMRGEGGGSRMRGKTSYSLVDKSPTSRRNQGPAHLSRSAA